MIVCRRFVLPRILFNFVSRRDFSQQRNSPESTNQLIKTLTKHGNYDRAFQLFDQLVQQNDVSIISLLTIVDTCTRSGQIERTNQIERFIHQSQKWKDNIRLQTSLINMHMKCQRIDQGKFFNRMNNFEIERISSSRTNLRKTSFITPM